MTQNSLDVDYGRLHRERRQRRKLTPTVMTASFSKEFAVK
jgi:hypothetical protein